MKRLLLLATVLAAAFTAAAGTASAESLAVNRVNCESGDTRFYCTASVTGGVAPFQERWDVINGTVTETFELSASGPCTLGSKVKATLTLTDATGQTASGSGTVICREVWPAA